MYRNLTKLLLGAVVSAAVIVVAFAFMPSPAYADHDPDHTLLELKGGLGIVKDGLTALELRVFNCEKGIGDSCPGTIGPAGAPLVPMVTMEPLEPLVPMVTMVTMEPLVPMVTMEPLVPLVPMVTMEPLVPMVTMVTMEPLVPMVLMVLMARSPVCLARRTRSRNGMAQRGSALSRTPDRRLSSSPQGFGMAT